MKCYSTESNEKQNTNWEIILQKYFRHFAGRKDHFRGSLINFKKMNNLFIVSHIDLIVILLKRDFIDYKKFKALVEKNKFN